MSANASIVSENESPNSFIERSNMSPRSEVAKSRQLPVVRDTPSDGFLSCRHGQRDTHQLPCRFPSGSQSRQIASSCQPCSSSLIFWGVGFRAGTDLGGRAGKDAPLAEGRWVLARAWTEPSHPERDILIPSRMGRQTPGRITNPVKRSTSSPTDIPTPLLLAGPRLDHGRAHQHRASLASLLGMALRVEQEHILHLAERDVGGDAKRRAFQNLGQ